MTVKLLENPREKTDRGSTLESRVSALENYIALLLGSNDIASGAVKNLHIGETLTVSNTEAKATDPNADQTSVNTAFDTYRVNNIASSVISTGADKGNNGFNSSYEIIKGFLNTQLGAKNLPNSGVRVDANGIYGRSSGITTFYLDTNGNAYFLGEIVSTSGSIANWTLSANKITGVNGLKKAELDSSVPHMKVAYNNTDVIQMAVVGTAPVLEVYYGGYIRTRLNKNSLNFFGTTGSSICTFYAQSSAGPGMYIDTPSNPLYVIAPQLIVDGNTLYLNYGTALNSLVANGTNLVFGGDTACNLIPNSSGSYNVGSASGYWNDIYLKRIRTLSFSTDPSSRDFGDMWHHYEGGGAKQFRGCPAGTTIYSFDMTVV